MLGCQDVVTLHCLQGGVTEPSHGSPGKCSNSSAQGGNVLSVLGLFLETGEDGS